MLNCVWNWNVNEPAPEVQVLSWPPPVVMLGSKITDLMFYFILIRSLRQQGELSSVQYQLPTFKLNNSFMESKIWMKLEINANQEFVQRRQKLRRKIKIIIHISSVFVKIFQLVNMVLLKLFLFDNFLIGFHQ